MKKHPKYARRLLKLAAFLEKLPPERFDIRGWVGDDWKGKPDLSCGTTACGLGWATTIPMLRKAGLRMKRDRLGGGHVGLARRHGSDHADASEVVFGLDSAETLLLFIPTSEFEIVPVRYGRRRLAATATPKQLARHIRAFVKRATGRAA